MSKDLAIGIVIGGAVSATLGSALGKTRGMVGDLQKKMEDTRGLRAMIGETQRLKSEMAAADQASRRIGLEGVRKLRGEVTSLQQDWHAATGSVTALGKKLSDLRAQGASKADTSQLEAEHAALEKSAKLAKSIADVKQAAWQDAKKNKSSSATDVLALKQEYEAASDAAKAQKLLATEKRNQIITTKEAAAAESKLASDFEKAQQAARRTKQAYLEKRDALHANKMALSQQAAAAKESARATVDLGACTRSLAKEQRAIADGGTRSRLGEHISQLKKAGIQAGELEASYVKIGRAIKGMEMQKVGATQMQSGVEIGRTAATAAATFAVPTKISADYQAIIRDIAIKSDIAGTTQEKTLDASIRKSASANGMGQTDLANAANALVSNGMSIERVIANLDVIGKFAVGQGSNGDETAKMVFAMSQAGVRDADMRQALEAIAYQGKQGSFESADMAKWLPSLLPGMNKLGIHGKDAVIQLGAMLQVQKKATGSADEAANNLKNWLSKIGAGDIKKNYEKAGIDYEKSMAEHIKAGMSPLEASMALAKQYIERIDPEKAAQMRQKADQLSSVKDEAERKRQLDAFAESMKMGDLFGDMQVKTALTAYMQNDAEYASLKKGGETASGVLDKGLEQRREASSQKWKEAGEAFQSAMVTVGDAIRPVTDRLADLAAGALKIGAAFATANPGVALAALGVTIGGLGIAAMKIGSGGALWAAGKVLEKVGVKLPGGKSGGARGGSVAGGLVGRALEAVTGGAGVQKVFVTNWDGAGGGLPDIPARATGGTAARGAGAASKFARVGKVGGALLAVGAAGYMAYDTYKNAKTPEQKGAGYGGAGGALAGGLAGAKVGAALGAFGGPVGMAVGGLAGGAVGALGGEQLGAWIGKAIAQYVKPGAALAAGGVATGAAMLSRKPAGTPAQVAQAAALARVAAPAAKAATPHGKAQTAGEKAKTTNQSFTFNPTIQVTVKGDVKDPRQVANEIAPHLRKIFDGWVAQAKRSAMHDPAGA